jgi:hypothetical protein
MSLKIDNNQSYYGQYDSITAYKKSSTDVQESNNKNTSSIVSIPASIVAAAAGDSAAMAEMQKALSSNDINLARKIVSEMVEKLQEYQRTEIISSIPQLNSSISLAKKINIIV